MQAQPLELDEDDDDELELVEEDGQGTRVIMEAVLTSLPLNVAETVIGWVSVLLQISDRK